MKNKKNKKKKRIITISSIVLIIIVISAAMIPSIIKLTEKSKNKKEIVEDVINNVFFDDSVTQQKLADTMNTVIIVDHVFIGTESAINNKPREKTIKKYNLEKYEKIQNKYSKNVEKRFREKSSYTIDNYDESMVDISVKPWYFDQYSHDLSIITLELLKRSNQNFEEEDLITEKFSAYEYKARTLALIVLDKHLDFYDNTKNEIRKVRIEYENNDPKAFNYFTLYLVLGGATSDRAPSRDPDYDIKEKTRLNNYIEEAINSGLIDKDKPVK